MNRLTREELTALRASVTAALRSLEPWEKRLRFLSWPGQCMREAVRYLRLLVDNLRREQGGA